ncbi:MAG TPA: hypothetical protein PLL64_04350 [Rhodothermales bacterium]|nr:hypothetical protein [Bacteroidota bacterium]HRK73483.1 hypothetical protein [Rhodothermales bacterium]HRR08962.1 hypothetical protein [Rhodothermales bacterium]
MQTTREFITPTLVLLLVIQGLVPLWVQLDFSRRQDYIRKVLCINRGNPEMKCNGKCYLKKRLIKTDQEQQKQQQSTTEHQIVGLVYVAPRNEELPEIGGALPPSRHPQAEEHPLEGTPVDITHPPNLLA